MNILILSPYPPYPPYGGGAMRIYQIIRGLAARHAVTCLTFAPDAAAEQALSPLQAICRLLVVRGPLPRSPLRRAWTTLVSPLPDMALRNASHAYSKILRQVLHDERFDIVQAESIEMAGYLQVLSAECKVLSAAHNTQHTTQSWFWISSTPSSSYSAARFSPTCAGRGAGMRPDTRWPSG